MCELTSNRSVYNRGSELGVFTPSVLLCFFFNINNISLVLEKVVKEDVLEKVEEEDVLEKLEDVLEKVVKEVEDNLLAKHLFFFF